MPEGNQRFRDKIAEIKSLTTEEKRERFMPVANALKDYALEYMKLDRLTDEELANELRTLTIKDGSPIKFLGKIDALLGVVADRLSPDPEESENE